MKITDKLESPPAHLALNAKHKFYVEMMHQLDKDNNKLREQIKRMSSDSHEQKDSDFHARRKRYASQLAAGRVAREAYRLRVRRMKKTIKNRSRAENGNITK